LKVVDTEFSGHGRRVRDDSICEEVADAFENPNTPGEYTGD
jgi:hypothetical protein